MAKAFSESPSNVYPEISAAIKAINNDPLLILIPGPDASQILHLPLTNNK
jgi:hypothetical protein